MVSQSVTTEGGDRPLRERLRLSAGETLDLLPPPLLKKVISFLFLFEMMSDHEMMDSLITFVV